MNRVAEWIENRRNVARDRRIMDPYIGHWQGEILGKRARPIDADPLGVFAQMPAAGEAIAAAAADHMPLAADDLADVKILDVRPGLDDPSDKLMPDRHGHGDRLL